QCGLQIVRRRKTEVNAVRYVEIGLLSGILDESQDLAYLALYDQFRSKGGIQNGKVAAIVDRGIAFGASDFHQKCRRLEIDSLPAQLNRNSCVVPDGPRHDARVEAADCSYEFRDFSPEPLANHWQIGSNRVAYEVGIEFQEAYRLYVELVEQETLEFPQG